jgi:hypothetical protein
MIVGNSHEVAGPAVRAGWVRSVEPAISEKSPTMLPRSDEITMILSSQASAHHGITPCRLTRSMSLSAFATARPMRWVTCIMPTTSTFLSWLAPSYFEHKAAVIAEWRSGDSFWSSSKSNVTIRCRHGSMTISSFEREFLGKPRPSSNMNTRCSAMESRSQRGAVAWPVSIERERCSGLQMRYCL